MRLRRKHILLVVGSIAVFILIIATLQEEMVIYNVDIPNQGLASIVSSRDSIIFDTYRADLFIYAQNGSVVLKTNLLLGLDCLEDAKWEFLSFRLNGTVLELNARGSRYKGTNIFLLPDMRK